MADRIFFLPVKADGVTPFNGATEEKQGDGITQLTNLNLRFGAATTTPISTTLLGRLQTVDVRLLGIYARQTDGTQKTQVTNPFALEATAQAQLTALGQIDSGERELPHATFDLTDAGDTPLITPALGKAIRVRWLSAINNPTATTAPKMKFRFEDGVPFYNVWALAKRDHVTGPVDKALIVNLSQAGDVACTVIYEEVTP